MFKLKTPEIYASEIAEFLNLELIGNDFIISYPCSLKNFKDHSFFYISDDSVLPKDKLTISKEILILTSKAIEPQNYNYSIIISDNPKIDFIKIINEFYIEFDTTRIASSAKIHKDAKIGRNVSIGENTIIGSDVKIGNNCKILNNVTITSRVEIGKDCIIKDNSTIGSEGYDFEIDDKGIPIQYPHIGKIIIGECVWIGANTSIESASLDNTIIGDFTKIDDLVQIGSNCNIEKLCMITAGCIISRNVKLGENSWLAPNVSIRDNIEIGKNVTVGVGAVVVKNLNDTAIYIGNPAHLLKKK